MRSCRAPTPRTVGQREPPPALGALHDKPFGLRVGVGHTESALPTEAEQRPGGVADWTLTTFWAWRRFHFHDTSPTAGINRLHRWPTGPSWPATAGTWARFCLLNQLDVADVIVAEPHGSASTFTQVDSAALGGWLEDFGVGNSGRKTFSAAA